MYEHSDVIDINSQERHESVQDLQRQVFYKAYVNFALF